MLEKFMPKSKVYDEVGVYFNEIGGMPFLKKDEESELTRKIKQLSKELKKAEGTDYFKAKREYENSVERLVEANLRLVVSIAKNYNGFGLDFIDLIGYGNIGLLHSIKKYDPDLGFKFSTYATWWIKQSIRRALSDNSRTVRLPVYFLEQQRKVNKIRAEFVNKFGREPTTEELARRTKLDKKKIRLMLTAMKVTSLDQICAEKNEDLEDKKGNMKQFNLDYKKAEHLKRILDELGPRQALILKARYCSKGGKGKTLVELSKRLGICRERVRQIEKEGIKRLRHPRRIRKLQGFLNQQDL